ncbi:Dyp-type peroxidase [Haematomicrobium sanguinis]|uniref:Dyp-type peroxidase n=1 Tax=Haematomicrobium sanguinis TaxID=479106 RepID=UPI00047EBF96|nr:Dyp-type peroxidase [Haematomicrobium sanguinis]
MSTPTEPENTEQESTGTARRHLLIGGAAAGVGAAAVAGYQFLGRRDESTPEAHTVPAGLSTVPYYGARQAGITTAAQAEGVFLALNFNKGVDKKSLGRFMSLLTDDAAKLTQGEGALADTEPELAYTPANLTITFGFGPRFFEIAGAKKPSWLKPLPAYGIDRLDPKFCDGDLLVQICGDDPLSVSHALRMIQKDSRTFASVAWTQRGFRRAAGSARPKTTMRNLFGQLDGTANPELGTEENEQVVWGREEIPAWIENGTSLVIRRIEMNLDKWDELDKEGRGESIGRRLDNGAPLTGTQETDEPDFEAKNPVGFPVIADFAHIRRARPEDPKVRIFRRGYNYDERSSGPSVSNSGLIFASYQADVDKQFTPIQDSLDKLDLLNQWTTPIGSAVFAIPPGCQEGEFIGQSLLA